MKSEYPKGTSRTPSWITVGDANSQNRQPIHHDGNGSSGDTPTLSPSPHDHQPTPVGGRWDLTLEALEELRYRLLDEEHRSMDNHRSSDLRPWEAETSFHWPPTVAVLQYHNHFAGLGSQDAGWDRLHPITAWANDVAANVDPLNPSPVRHPRRDPAYGPADIRQWRDQAAAAMNSPSTHMGLENPLPSPPRGRARHLQTRTSLEVIAEAEDDDSLPVRGTANTSLMERASPESLRQEPVAPGVVQPNLDYGPQLLQHDGTRELINAHLMPAGNVKPTASTPEVCPQAAQEVRQWLDDN